MDLSDFSRLCDLATSAFSQKGIIEDLRVDRHLVIGRIASYERLCEIAMQQFRQNC